jgi:hypothetical protein
VHNYSDAINLFDLNPYKIVKSIEKEVEEVVDDVEDKLKKPFLEEDWMDKVYKVFLAICIVYYIFDVGVKLTEMAFPSDYADVCKVSFGLHHIMTILGFKSVWMLDHYPWFIAGPMAYHTTIVGFPTFPLNNALYFLTIIAWMYNLLREPFWNLKVYKCLFLTSVLLMIPIVFLW